MEMQEREKSHLEAHRLQGRTNQGADDPVRVAGRTPGRRRGSAQSNAPRVVHRAKYTPACLGLNGPRGMLHSSQLFVECCVLASGVLSRRVMNFLQFVQAMHTFCRDLQLGVGPQVSPHKTESRF